MSILIVIVAVASLYAAAASIWHCLIAPRRRSRDLIDQDDY